VVDPVNIFLSSRSITKQQNMILVSHSTCAYSRSCQILGDIGALPLGTRGVADPWNTLLSHACCHAKFGRSLSNGTSVCTEIRLKNGLLVSCFSRSPKVAGTDTDRSYDFLLLIYITMGLSRIASKVNGDFGRKSQIFHTRVI